MINRVSRPQKVLYYSLLALMAVVILFPIYYMITISLKLPRDIYRTPSLLPVQSNAPELPRPVGHQSFPDQHPQ